MPENTKNAKQSDALGYAFAVMQAVLYSTMGIVCKFMLGTGMTTQQVMLLRFVFTVVLLGAFLLVWRKQRLFSRNPLTWLMGVLFFFSAYLYYVGVDMLTAGMATVIYFVYPAVVAILGIFVFHEKFSARLVVVIVLVLGGIFCISEVYLPGKAVLDPVGIGITIFACVCFALYTVAVQWIGQHAKLLAKGERPDGPLTTTFDVAIVCLIISLVVFSDQVPSLLTLNPVQISCGAYMAIFNTIVPLFLFALAIERIGATKTSLIGTSETPCSLFLAWLLLGEVASAGQLVGAALIVIAVVLVATGKPKR